MSKTRKYKVPGGGSRSMHGGGIAELSKPHKRWYDDRRRKREVKVSCYVFWGVGRHYYVHLQEDDNAIWNEEKKLWQICWDDPQRGKQFDQKFGNIVEAREWVRKLQKKHFPKRTHKLTQDWHNLQWKEDKAVWLGIYKQGD